MKTSWNLPDSQLCLESKTEPSVAKALNYIKGGGGHRTEKTYSGRGRGDTAHTLLMGGNNWDGDTEQH